jgi:zinc transport system ATP-binding protein
MNREAANAIITCQNVSFGYEGRRVVRGLSFTVYEGDYLCVVGENGCGKTTLLKGLLRFLNPLDGGISFADEIKKTAAGYLPQQSAAKKDFPASVEEIVLSGTAGALGLRPFYSREEKKTAEENMERLEITEIRGHCFRELSGGQQRRVLIARALCVSRKFLALDEPAAGLDQMVSLRLYELLARLNEEAGTTVIMVTHDLLAAEKYARHILRIKSREDKNA